jgi:hypothetical protein
MNTKINPALSPECMSVLEACGFRAKNGTGLVEGWVVVTDKYSDREFTVTPGISHQDLRTIISEGRKYYRLGREAGAEEIRRDLKKLMGCGCK